MSSEASSVVVPSALTRELMGAICQATAKAVKDSGLYRQAAFCKESVNRCFHVLNFYALHTLGG